MASTAILRAAADDGINTYLFIEISDGQRTMPLVQASVPTGTTQALVRRFLQNIANNAPAVAAAVQALVNVPITGQ